MMKMIGSFNSQNNQINDYATLEEIHATLQDDEYIDSQGNIRCSKCNTERMIKNPFTNHYCRCLCECKVQEHKQERIDNEEERRKAYLRGKSLLVGKYENATFDNADLSDVDNSYVKVFNRCKKYANIPETVLENGYGIYLYGSCGSGKTYLSACIANRLLEQGYSCIFTNMIDISQRIRTTFGKYGMAETEDSIIRNLSEVPFLFIDDIGTERLVDNNGNENWLQDIVYTIFNNRYTNNMPTILTSNYAPNKLTTERGLMRKITERIGDMTCCGIMVLETKFRQRDIINKNKNVPF